MKIEAQLNLIDLKRAMRRLMLRLDDEIEGPNNFVTFSAHGHFVEIIVGATRELLDAGVVLGGQARLPCPLFRGIARALRFYRARRTISVVLIPGVLRIGTTEYRHPNMTVQSADPDIIATAKPAKLQNL